MTSRSERVQKICALNDQFRKYPWNSNNTLSRTMVTPGVNAKGPECVLRVLNAVAGFNTFTVDNDPHREHDFGVIKLDGETFYWKIDYYDKALKYGSEDPSNPDVTTRILTIMLASEY